MMKDVANLSSRDVEPDVTIRSDTSMEIFLARPLVRSFLSGLLSGTCSTILLQPFDLIKTRLQTPIALEVTSQDRMLPLFISIIREEKVVGLWRGTAPSLARTVPGIGIYFSMVHSLSLHFSTSAELKPLESIAIGIAARSLTAVVTMPFTVVKTRFESDHSHYPYKNMLQAFRAIYRTERIRGLFSGLTATLFRDAPFSGIYLMFYTHCKRSVTASGMLSDPHSAGVHFCCGIAAGCLAAFVTQPADVVKTHMQLHRTNSKPLGIAKTISLIYRKEGPLAFLRGLVPRTLRRTLMAALSWTLYEEIMRTVGLK